MTTPGNSAPNTIQTTASQIIGIAEGEKGQYSAVNKFNSWYGLPGTEWCDEFVSWVFDQAKDINAIGGKFSFTVAHAQYFKSVGRWTTGSPEAGYVVFFSWSGSKSISAIQHVGIVTGPANADGSVPTVEGNTGNNQVATRNRTPAYIVGYGIPNVSGLGTPGPSSATPAGITNVGNPLDVLTKPLTAVENVIKFLINPVFWKRVGLFGMGLLVIAIGIAFIARKRLESAAKIGAL